MEDEESCSKQNASVEGVSQVRIPNTHPSTEKTDTCDMCGPFMKDILHLDEHQGTHPEETPYTCGACARGFWFNANLPQRQKEHSGEKSCEGASTSSSLRGHPSQTVSAKFCSITSRYRLLCVGVRSVHSSREKYTATSSKLTGPRASWAIRTCGCSVARSSSSMGCGTPWAGNRLWRCGGREPDADRAALLLRRQWGPPDLVPD